MRLPAIPKIYWTILSILLVAVSCSFLISGHRVDYNTEIKPLLNKKCITCHGGVKRQGGFSLLFRQDALAVNKSGKAAIVPGDPSHSEMIRRLTLTDPEERMPYKHPPLTSEEVGMLKNWIKQGAVWGNHWAYTAVQPESVPKNGTGPFGWFRQPDWIKNDVDQFIYPKIKKEGLTPSPEADKATLLRRLSLDLTGVPAPENISRYFLNDNSATAYEHLVDTLLASPRYGERWAAMWMDLARYSDTKGYERDDKRYIWRYRDWLIKAFNDNKPYNQFLVEQLAGDLLPDPTDAQFIATAFHRNTMTNDEGGTDNEEFRIAAVLDRVNTTWEALMGTTFACVQCHSHPYDPFRHEEYYQFMAFFNNTRDEDTFDDYPLLREFHQQDSSKLIALKSWLHRYAPLRERELTQFVRTGQPAINSIAADELVNSALTDTKWLVLRNHAVARIKDVDVSNRSQLYYRFKSWGTGGNLVLHLDKADGPVIDRIQVADAKGKWQINKVPLPPASGKHHLYMTYTNAQLKKPEDTGIQFDWFFFTNPFPGKGSPGYDSAYKYYEDLMSPSFVSNTPVMMDNPRELFRPTYVFERGNWLMKGQQVVADVPRSLGGLPPGAPRNRLGLALWLTDIKNPLTARTIVNRIWEQFFGQGIAETLEDLGTQGMPPTHRELLDHLSWQLMTSYHWDLKKLMKDIVMSATYRQDSRSNEEAIKKDPNNKLYARGSRVRLSAEQIRDQALAVSGLLSEKMFGPSVMPFQPEGIWMSPWNASYWKKSDSVDQYRRALYTYWKRSAPYPSMITFDGTAREVCTARRIRTNTPLQALTTLNDSVYVETAQHFALRMRSIAGNDPGRQISKGYELAMYHPITAEKRYAFEKLYITALKQFREDHTKMCETAGDKKENQTPEIAAMTVVAGAMMNIDEFITKN